MSNYTVTGKPSFNSALSSSDIRNEFTNIATAINSKLDPGNALNAFPETVVVGASVDDMTGASLQVTNGLSLDGTLLTASAAELNTLDGVVVLGSLTPADRSGAGMGSFTNSLTYSTFSGTSSLCGTVTIPVTASVAVFMCDIGLGAGKQMKALQPCTVFGLSGAYAALISTYNSLGVWYQFSIVNLADGSSLTNLDLSNKQIRFTI